MGLREVDGARFLLGSCADPLETLRICPTGQAGKGFVIPKGPCSSELVTHRNPQNLAAGL